MDQPYKINPQELFEIFKNHHIKFENFEHSPVFTVEESKELTRHVKGTHCRNLALVNKKKHMWLFTLRDSTPVDLKKLGEQIGGGRLSFMRPERLWDTLGVRPGSVTPFSILNDKDAKNVTMVLEKEMIEDEELVNYHPMCNTQSTAISPKDLVSFIKDIANHEPELVSMHDIKPEEESASS